MIILLLLLIPFAVHAQCGSNLDRWKAKTLTDGSTLTDSAIRTTISDQVRLPRFVGPWQSANRYPIERELMSLEGDIVMAGEEGDNDFHLVITNEGDSMIVEIPSPDDCSEIAIHATEYRAARAKAVALLGPIKGRGIHAVTPTHVRITAYGFFDKRAHGSGHAPNGREIHPVLRIE